MNFEGRREDKFGTARVFGQIANKLVSFTVNYDNKAILAGGLEGEINFNGQKIRGKFIGEYPAQQDRGSFEMKKFNPNKSLY
ncbi:MAG: hypothetical protein AABX65_04235 [Nanoarchaeota archaeon]